VAAADGRNRSRAYDMGAGAQIAPDLRGPNQIQRVAMARQLLK
jgi:hypothetical protein